MFTISSFRLSKFATELCIRDRYVCVELDAGQTPDAVNYLYFCHNARNLVSVGQRVKSGDALAVMGSTGNAALASPPFAHCHFEGRATAAGAGLDPTAYTVHPNAVGTDGEAIDETEDSDMKFLEVTSGKCEVFTAPDVNAVDKHYNGGKLTAVSYTHLNNREGLRVQVIMPKGVVPGI